MNWRQTYREITIDYVIDRERNDKVEVTTGDCLIISKNREVILNKELSHKVKQDETVWSLEQNNLEIVLTKEETGVWKSLFVGEAEEEYSLETERITHPSELGEEAQRVIEKAMAEGNLYPQV